MNLAERVARLFSGQKPLGSAWLISPAHALTACHCIRDGDRFHGDLALRFGDEPRMARVALARPADACKDLDVALLTVIDHNGADLDRRVIPLSRRMPAPSARICAVGYPQSTSSELLTPLRVDGVVGDTQASFLDATTSARIQIHVTAQISSFEQLTGASGGAVWLADDEGTPGGPFATAVLLRALQVLPDNVYAVPVSSIARRFEEVHRALQSSPHRVDGVLAIAAADDDRLQWSCGYAPADAGELWSDQTAVQQFVCDASRRAIGTDCCQALLRLLIHSNLRSIHVRSCPDWEDDAACLGFSNRPSFAPYSPTAAFSALAALPAPPVCFQPDGLAEEIHGALDRGMLHRMDRELQQNLWGGSRQRFSIDGGLKRCMRELWQSSWLPTLERQPALLRQFLVRLASCNETESPGGLALVQVGPRLPPEVLGDPLLFSLALSASGINIDPAKLDRGNARATTQQVPAHVCGAEKLEGVDVAIALGRANPPWNVPLVVLPPLREPYARLWRRSISMRHRPGRPRLDAPGLPPVIIPRDGAFLDALEKGADALVDYVRMVREEIRLQIEEHYGSAEAALWTNRFPL